MVKNGVVVGRFQPFHKGHLRYVQEALKRCDHLFIGITTPGEKPTKYEPNQMARLGKENNPFTYEERVEMISRALATQGRTLSNITFVHFDPRDVDSWHAQVPKDATYFLLLVGDEEKKVEDMKAQGLQVEVLETINKRQYTSGVVRERMENDENWEELVPKPVAEYLKGKSIVRRLGELSR